MRERLWRHLWLAVRVFSKNYTFSVVTMGTLALGIGATSAIFSVIDSTLLRTGTYDDSRLVLIAGVATSSGARAPLSFPNFEYLQKRSHSFSAMAAFADESFTLTGRGEPQQLKAARVSWNFFPLLKVRPVLGRMFLPEEDRIGGKDVVVISHSLWMNRFGASSAAIGQSLTLDSRPYTIVGILPAAFKFPFLGPGVDIWTPRLFDINIGTPAWVAGGAGFLNVVAQLKPGHLTNQAQSEVSSLYQSFRLENPARPDSNPQNHFEVAEFREQATSNFRLALLALFTAVSVLLMIACCNTANLMLARFLERRHEMAIRLALGASRSDIIATLLTESTVLAFAGGSLGLLLAYAATPQLTRLITKETLIAAPAHLNWHLLLFTETVSLLCGLLFGIFPALRLSQPVAGESALGFRGGTGDRSRSGLSSLLVVFEITLSVILVVSATLMMRSFVQLCSVAPGFDPVGVVTMRLTLSSAKYSNPEQIRTFHDKALQTLQLIPDVDYVSVSSALPLMPARLSPMLLEGQLVRPLSERPILPLQMVSPDYPAVFGIPVVHGRRFTEHDNARSERVALVNEQLARTYWPGEDPLGKRIWIGRLTTPTLVVGVLANTRNTSLTQSAQPEVLVPFVQLPWAFLNISFRTRHQALRMVPAALRHLASIDKDQPVTDIQTASQILDSALIRPRTNTLLVVGFSSVALLFAVIGIYGILAYSVGQRTREMGIRMALGASGREVLLQVAGTGMRLTTIGLLLGLAASLAITRLLTNLLYSTGAHDPLSFVFAAVLFLATGVLASYFPARRATRLDPVDALRNP